MSLIVFKFLIFLSEVVPLLFMLHEGGRCEEQAWHDKFTGSIFEE